MSGKGVASRGAPGAHVCRSCALPLVQPEGRAPAGPRWLVRLWCPNCNWSGEALLDQSQVDRFDEEFDEGVGQLAEDLARITAANMREYADRVAAALTSDAVLPEDF
jgi:hypothetical protein